MNTIESFSQYIETYNKGDYDTILNRYYTDDVIFDSGTGAHAVGREEVKKFLIKSHAHVSEKLLPQAVAFGENVLASEVLGEFACREGSDRNKFEAIFKASADEVVRMRLFAFYHLRGDKAFHVKVAIWPVGRL